MNNSYDSNENQPSRRDLFRLGAGIAGAGILGALGGLPISAAMAEEAGVGPYPATPKWKFAFINPNTTDMFFQPSQYAIEDASKLLGVSVQWTGSQSDKVAEMVSAMNAVISARIDGIVVNMVDPQAFNEPTKRALDAGIPVISYNSDTPNARLAFVGQDKYVSGRQIGEKLVVTVPEGKIVVFISSPGSLANTPTLRGIMDVVKESGKPIKADTIVIGTDPNQQQARVDSYYQGNPDVKGMFATGSGETQAVGKIMQKYGLAAKGVRAGGMDLLPTTIKLIADGHLDFAVDETPYYQGFLPVFYLYMYKLTGTLLAPASSNTGVRAVTKADIKPFLKANRFIGTSKDYLPVN
ncbi:substrate-binding domain-containing protein [Rhizobium sp. NLR17b]|uniref:substrate-binding domain-containing protein n=1 Tax=Rhizobium sp. NLR17b TaxID=2731114 RepID=UPI001C83F10E|nr:substrate-binding domain-containing protein [Rhizobium sp. NLR17b]MBX5272673.1 substrate-binding domain-containing protein [Rhizobium sp. NLR17b]